MSSKDLKQQLTALLKARASVSAAEEAGKGTRLPAKRQELKRQKVAKSIRQEVANDPVLSKRQVLERNLVYLQRTLQSADEHREVLEKVLPGKPRRKGKEEEFAPEDER